MFNNAALSPRIAGNVSLCSQTSVDSLASDGAIFLVGHCCCLVFRILRDGGRGKCGWHCTETLNFRVWANQPELASRVAARVNSNAPNYGCFGAKEKPFRPKTSPRPQIRQTLFPIDGQAVARSSFIRLRHSMLPRWVLAGSAVLEQVTGDWITEKSLNAGLICAATSVIPCVAALPHELTHLVIADRFPTQPLPRWLDEGIAILADPVSKQHGHETDWLSAQRQATAFRLVEILEQHKYPSSTRVQTFYGQSAAMVRDLLRRKSPADLLLFIEKAQERGYDFCPARALRTCGTLVIGKTSL